MSLQTIAVSCTKDTNINELRTIVQNTIGYCVKFELPAFMGLIDHISSCFRNEVAFFVLLFGVAIQGIRR